MNPLTKRNGPADPNFDVEEQSPTADPLALEEFSILELEERLEFADCCLTSNGSSCNTASGCGKA